MFTKFFSHENQNFPLLTSRFLVRGTVQICYFSRRFGDSELWPLEGRRSELWSPFHLKLVHRDLPGMLRTKFLGSLSVGIGFENFRFSEEKSGLGGLTQGM